MALALQEILSALTKSKVEVIINQNRSTMVSVLERRRNYARLSIHEMFLEAPNSVVEALVYLLKNKRNDASSKLIHNYIDQNSSKYEYNDQLDKSKLITQGKVYDLDELYQKINATYFSSSLNLHITWFGTQQKLPKRQISFGLYHEPLKLIKINRLLDTFDVPQFFVEFIIYHEMLHEIYRPKRMPSGRRSVHTQEFKEKEKLFLEFQKVKAFEKEFKKVIFK